MMKIRSIAAVCLVAAAGTAAQAQVVQPINLTQSAIGSASTAKSAPLPAAPQYAWTVDLSKLDANISVFGFPVAQPLSPMLIPANDLDAAGVYFGGPGNMYTRTYTFTDIGQASPSYTFTIKVDLLADQTVQTTLDLQAKGIFSNGGMTGAFGDTPVQSITAAGTTSVVAVPAPGAAALAGMGGLLAIRRRRRHEA